MFEGTELEITFSTDHTSDLNELQKIVESEILTDRFRQRRLPEGTFDEDACVICYDDMDCNPDLKFTVFLPCKHSATCFDCTKQNSCSSCPLCKQNIDETIYEREAPEWELVQFDQTSNSFWGKKLKNKKRKIMCCFFPVRNIGLSPLVRKKRTNYVEQMNWSGNEMNVDRGPLLTEQSLKSMSSLAESEKECIGFFFQPELRFGRLIFEIEGTTHFAGNSWHVYVDKQVLQHFHTEDVAGRYVSMRFDENM